MELATAAPSVRVLLRKLLRTGLPQLTLLAGAPTRCAGASKERTARSSATTTNTTPEAIPILVLVLPTAQSCLSSKVPSGTAGDGCWPGSGQKRPETSSCQSRTSVIGSRCWFWPSHLIGSGRCRSVDAVDKEARHGTITAMFDLRDTRYIEGAPIEWRRWLTPGLSVVLRFQDDGLTIFGPDGERAHLPWEGVTAIDVRGPDELSYPSGVSGGIPGVGLVPLLVWLYFRARNKLPQKVEFSWLAFRLTTSTEVIFEVEGALHDKLEVFLESHSG
jgi:hypothetical protein